jgi:hypothetical protein
MCQCFQVRKMARSSAGGSCPVLQGEPGAFGIAHACHSVQCIMSISQGLTWGLMHCASAISVEEARPVR